MTNAFTQFLAGKTLLAMLVLAIGFVPVVGAMQLPADHCTPGAERACALNSAEVDDVAPSCCDVEKTDAPAEPSPSGDDDPCDCNCCDFLTAPSPIASVNLAGPAISLDSVSLLSILAPLRPDSATLVVDIQPPIV